MKIASALLLISAAFAQSKGQIFVASDITDLKFIPTDDTTVGNLTKNVSYGVSLKDVSTEENLFAYKYKVEMNDGDAFVAWANGDESKYCVVKISASPSVTLDEVTVSAEDFSGFECNVIEIKDRCLGHKCQGKYIISISEIQ